MVLQLQVRFVLFLPFPYCHSLCQPVVHQVTDALSVIPLQGREEEAHAYYQKYSAGMSSLGEEAQQSRTLKNFKLPEGPQPQPQPILGDLSAEESEKYAKMVQVGIPLEQVKSKMQQVYSSFSIDFGN